VHEQAAKAIEEATQGKLGAPLLPPEYATLATPSWADIELGIDGEIKRPPAFYAVDPAAELSGRTVVIRYNPDGADKTVTAPLTEASKVPETPAPKVEDLFKTLDADEIRARYRNESRRGFADFDIEIRGFGEGTIDYSWRKERTAPHAPPRDAELLHRHRRRTKWFSLEEESPLPYGRPPEALVGSAELTPFRLDVVSIRFERYDSFYGPPFASSMKSLYLHVRVAPRKGEVHHNVKQDERGEFIDLYANMQFEESRPDALCIRELLLNFVRHEVEESILVNGVRIWDPHVGRPGGI
jgi:hypothetical protein